MIILLIFYDNFTEAYAISDSFKVKEKTAAKTDGNGTKMLK